VAELVSSEPEELRALGVEAARADGFGLGVAVLGALVDCFGPPAICISLGGLREGVLLRELSRAAAERKVEGSAPGASDRARPDLYSH
jgi:exopolyphosphatase/pppGpp-phosphohydrolase